MDTNDLTSAKAKQIADALERLIEVEQAESDTKDVKPLEDALALIREFAGAEEKPKVDAVAPIDAPVKPVVDTDVLAGPMPALKSFLIKSQRDNESKI